MTWSLFLDLFMYMFPSSAFSQSLCLCLFLTHTQSESRSLGKWDSQDSANVIKLAWWESRSSKQDREILTLILSHPSVTAIVVHVTRPKGRPSVGNRPVASQNITNPFFGTKILVQVIIYIFTHQVMYFMLLNLISADSRVLRWLQWRKPRR